VTIREIKFRPKIAQHDYDTKKSHVERFLRHKDKVKITIMFRGREVTHPERGTAILDRLATELAEFGVVEQHPTQEGRNMTMLMAPSKAVLAGRTELSVVPAETSGDGAAPAEQSTAAADSQASNGGVAGEAGGGDAGATARASESGGDGAGASPRASVEAASASAESAVP
jgi:translation initiation factor IF-3